MAAPKVREIRFTCRSTSHALLGAQLLPKQVGAVAGVRKLRHSAGPAPGHRPERDGRASSYRHGALFGCGHVAWLKFRRFDMRRRSGRLTDAAHPGQCRTRRTAGNDGGQRFRVERIEHVRLLHVLGVRNSRPVEMMVVTARAHVPDRGRDGGGGSDPNEKFPLHEL